MFNLQKNMRRAPFYLISVGNAALLITNVALGDYCENAKPDSPCGQNKIIEVDLVRGLITLEAMIIMCFWGKYLRDAHRFQREKNLPDVLRAEARRRLMLCGSNEGAANNPDEEESQSQVLAAVLDGERQRSAEEVKQEILERQAELLRYLHSHVEVQNDRILELVAEKAELGRRLDNTQAALERAEESRSHVRGGVRVAGQGDEVEVVTHQA